jgi:hypothetical protein
MPFLSDPGGEEAQGRNSGPSTPIAIIGLSCRFPGDAATPASFWESLLEQKCEQWIILDEPSESLVTDTQGISCIFKDLP